MVEATLGNARFFRRSGPYPLAVVASTSRGVADEVELLLQGVAPLQAAGPNEVSFLDNRRYASALDYTLAGAVIVHPDMAARVPTTAVAIVTSEPYAAWARVAALFYPVPPPSPGIHPSAIVADGAHIDPSTEVGPLSVIETGAEIGPGCRIGPCAVIGSGVTIARDCRIGAHVSLSYAHLGARVYVYPGARIGQEGFGFASTKDGFLSVSSGESSLKTMLKLVLIRRLIADHRETRSSAPAPASITSCRSATTLSSAGVVSSLHRSVFRVQPCLRISSASGAGGHGRTSSDRSRCGDRSAGGRPVRYGSRRKSAWKPRAAKNGVLPANCHPQEDGKERRIRRLNAVRRASSGAS
jgi:hypothetical protein